MIATLALLAVFVAVFARAITLGARDYIRDQRLAEHIGQIGYDQRHGQVEIITETVLSERRR